MWMTAQQEPAGPTDTSPERTSFITYLLLPRHPILERKPIQMKQEHEDT